MLKQGSAIRKHASRSRLSFQCLDVAALTSELAQGSATAAYKSECLFHRPVALDWRMSIDIGHEAGQGQSDKDHMQHECSFHRHR